MKSILTITVVAFVLTACGGSTETPTVDVHRSDLQEIVSTPTYDANSANLASFNAINAFRASLGLGLWAQNTNLDRAAQNHVDYLVTNTLFSHQESPRLAGFTGIDATKRCAYVGYSAKWIGEVGVTQIGVPGVAALINTVYHRSALMDQRMTEVGIENSANPLVPRQFISYGNNLKTQYNSADFTAVYPLDGQKGVELYFVNELPNPFPSLFRPSAPISFVSSFGTRLKITHFTVTPHGSSTPLVTQLITQETDPNGAPNRIYLRPHEAYISAVQPFLPNIRYDVSFEGTVDDEVVKKEWSFTTGAR